jgi:catechol 2,3-dioxygenase-like lactoylglutathione lyase family enzyme
MSHTQVRRDTAIETPTARRVDMKPEVVVIPVSDVDRAKRFSSNLGWRLDADFVRGDEYWVVQFTPPGSSGSIHFGTGVTSAMPGSAQGRYRIVSDIEYATRSTRAVTSRHGKHRHASVPSSEPRADHSAR